MQAVILVGGQGTRLRPLTLTTPKPLVPLANRPVIEHVARWLAGHGIDQIVLATQYRAAAFAPWLRRYAQAAPGVLVRAVEEPEPRGTAGAVAHVAPELHGTTIVVNGDNLIDLDLAAMLAGHRASDAVATIATDAVDDVAGRGVVVSGSDGRVRAFQEKPAPYEAQANTVNTGVYLLEMAAINAIPRDRFCSFERDVFPHLIGSGAHVAAFQSRHRWIDTGTPEGYLAAQAAVLHGTLSAPAGDHDGSVWRENNVTIDGNARVDRAALGFGTMVAAHAQITGSSVGRECHVLAGATIDRSAVWHNCQIERGATIRASIIGHDCYIGANTRVDAALLGDGCIIAAGAIVPAGTKLPPATRWPSGVALDDGAA